MMGAPEALRLIWAQTWQLTLLIAVVALIVRFTSRRRPFLAHALWLVVLMKCVTPPLWSSPGGVFCWLETAFRPAAQVANLTGQPLAAPMGIGFDTPNAALEGRPDLVVRVHDGSGGSEPRGMDTHIDRIDEANRSVSFAAWFLVVWLTGTAAMLAVALWRWWRCWSQLCRQRTRHDATYDASLSRLAKRLKLRRPVRLMVTASRFGPAVIGLMRPVIVLPEMIVQGKSPADLEPILAHELIHVRRGDLWVGMLQVISLGLWWFHPLVWFVSRWISREAERCCDEAVLAALGCEPSRYARCLLDVLERKQLLRPVPAFPGVRPVEITSQRLERIMQLRQGCRNRTPWWCWFVALGLAAATLPGAAWVAADDQPADLAPPWQPQPVFPQPAAPPLSSANRVARAPLGPLVTHPYELAGVLAKTRAELGCGTSDARSRIADEMAAAGGSEWAKLGVDVVQDEAGRLEIRDDQRDLTQPELHWKGTTAIVRHDEQGHQRIAERITQIRRYGFAQLLIEVQLITARSEVVERAVPAWRLSPVEISKVGDSSATAAGLNQSDPWAAEAEQRPGNRSVSSIEQQGPFQFQVVDANQWRRIEAVLKEDRSTKLLSAPTIVTHNGRSAMVHSGGQRPFVVGLKDEEPQVQVITEGITLQVTPELIAAKPAEQGSREVAAVVHLAEIPQAKVTFNVSHSVILDVATRTIKVAGRDKLVTLQVPRVQSSRVESTVVAPLDQTLVIGGLQMQDEQHGTRSLLVTMTVRRATAEGGKTMFGVGVNSDAGVTSSLGWTRRRSTRFRGHPFTHASTT
jgi:beta-lactamase regulating signal transducer with metallopeptidase domain